MGCSRKGERALGLGTVEERDGRVNGHDTANVASGERGGLRAGDYFWFGYDEDAFSLMLKKTAGGLSIAETKAKQPLADGFQVDQKLPETPTGAPVANTLASSRGLLVLKATYGAGQTQRDVKDLVKTKIQNGRLDFRAHSGQLGGDPVFGQVKTFYIKYVADGRVVEKSFREGEHVSLP